MIFGEKFVVGILKLVLINYDYGLLKVVENLLELVLLDKIFRDLLK